MCMDFSDGELKEELAVAVVSSISNQICMEFSDEELKKELFCITFVYWCMK